MEANYKSSSLTMDAGTMVLTGPKSFGYSTIWQDKPAGAVVQCYCDAQSNTAIAEINSAQNPRTGCNYQLIDGFQNTTFFVRDDILDGQRRYSSAQAIMESFAQNFSGSGLYGDQLAIAYAAFSLSELGRSFLVIADPTETALINFCKARSWVYQILPN